MLKRFEEPEMIKVKYIGGRKDGQTDEVPAGTQIIEDRNVDLEGMDSAIQALEEMPVALQTLRLIEEQFTSIHGVYELKGIKEGFHLFVLIDQPQEEGNNVKHSEL